MTAPYFSQKISINQITQNKNLLTVKEAPSLPNHITWEEQSQTEDYQLKQTQSRPRPQSRRKIFQKFESKYDSNKLVSQIDKVREKSKEKSGGKLHKVKSNPQVTFQDQRIFDQTELRIQQINRQLKQHRQSLANSKTTKRDNCHFNDAPYWTKIEERLAQSKEILQRQEEMLTTKIPTFQKKIEDNSTAINQVTRLLKLKLQSQSHKVEGLVQMMEKNEDRLRNKQQELSRINSELLAKESQIMKNKEVNKRRELELQRIKRIEDLQNKNLEIYQSIEKKGDLSQFADFKLQPEEMEEDHGECWGDSVCESKVTVNKISTIQYSGDRSHNYSENDTIGELLSPLALIDNQYVI